MPYLWNPELEKEAEARERKRERKRDRERGIRMDKGGVYHDAKTGRTTVRKPAKARFHDAKDKD